MQINLSRILPRLIASAAVVTLACGFQYAYITSGTTGLPLKWAPGSIPMRILADNTTVLSDGTTRATSIQAAMTDAARGWNSHLGNVQFVPQILPTGSGVGGDGLNQIFFSSTAYGQSFDANTVAVTVSWYAGSQRVESDIIFNQAVTWDSYRGTLRSNAVDIQRVALRELGRVLGLDYPDKAGLTVQAVMNSQVSDIDQIQVYDVLAAEFLYGPPGVAVNDNLAAATSISLLNNAASLKGYNTNATKETGEPNHAGNAGGRSVWWKWAAPSTGTMTVTTAGSVFDTTLGIYSGASVSALTQVASNDNVQNGVDLSSAVTFPVAAGTTYYIAVDGNNAGSNGADSGGIALTITFVPANGVQGQTVVTGHGVTFTVTGASGTVQWQVSTNNGLTWTNLTDGQGGIYTGVTTPSLTISTVNSGMSGLRYRAVLTGTNGVSSASDSGTLLVSQAVFSFPSSIAIDALGGLYVGDTSQNTIQKILSPTTVSPFAGTANTVGSTDGLGGAAHFNQPNGLNSTPSGVVAVSDTANGTIRIIQPDGTVTTLAGNPSVHGNTDATGSAATFSSPIGIARDPSGNLYVADAMNHTIRKVTTAGVVTTFAGSAGAAGAVDGTGTAARFNYPTGIAVDGSGIVYVSDTTNNLIRKITPAGAVTTLAGVVGVAGSSDGTGSAALFNTPGGLAVDGAGNVYLADTGNSTIRKITPAGVVTTLAGLPGIAGFRDGTGSDAWFNQPKSLVVDGSGNIFVADTGNATVRKITSTGQVTSYSLTVAIASTTTTTSTSTIPPTGGSTSSGGGGGAPSTWFFGALGILTVCRKLFLRRK